MLKTEWIDKGYIDEPVADDFDLKENIKQICKEKNAIILAHYYTNSEIQEIAHFIGDSLALAQQAAKTNADVIVMCGVHFMAETNKILCPNKLVLIPDLNAGCSLADSCNADDLKKYKEEHPNHKVISYVNTSASVKALTDIVVTSGNAEKIINSLPKDEKIIFGPDYNLGSYINSVTGRNMLLWNGGCHVHERFSVQGILNLKKEHPNAKVLAHPECKSTILALADVIGSTKKIIDYAQSSNEKEFIVVTEAGILYELQRTCSDKTFYAVPPEISEDSLGCSCNECAYMKMNTLLKIYNCLKYEWPNVEVDNKTAEKAVKSINRMLELS